MAKGNGGSQKNPTVQIILGNTCLTKSMAKVNSGGKVAIIISVNTTMMKEMVLERCCGLTAHTTPANGKEVSNMVSEE
jgi:hypothetical protein